MKYDAKFMNLDFPTAQDLTLSARTQGFKVVSARHKATGLYAVQVLANDMHSLVFWSNSIINKYGSKITQQKPRAAYGN